MFGIQFSRRQRRRLQGDGESFEPAHLGIVIDGSCCSDLASSFLHLVLGYIRKSNLSVSQLSGFLLTETVSCAFAWIWYFSSNGAD